MLIHLQIQDPALSSNKKYSLSSSLGEMKDLFFIYATMFGPFRGGLVSADGSIDILQQDKENLSAIAKTKTFARISLRKCFGSHVQTARDISPVLYLRMRVTRFHEEAES